MKAQNTSSSLKKLICISFYSLAALCVVLSLQHVATSDENLSRQIKKFLEHSPESNDHLKEHLAQQKEKAQHLTRVNFFSPIIPKPPVLMSVMGSEAMINDRWYKVGDKINDEVIKSIHPKYIELEKESKTRQLKILGY